MTEKNWSKWGVAIACASILVGCGGDGKSDVDQAKSETSTTVPSALTGQSVTLPADAGTTSANTDPSADHPHAGETHDQDVAAAEGQPDPAVEPGHAPGHDIVLFEGPNTTNPTPAVENIAPEGQPGKDGAVAQDTEAGRFAGKELQPFYSHGVNDYINAQLKFVISSVGPQNLVDHLQHLVKTSPDLATRSAATKFIGLVNDAYDPSQRVSHQVSDLQKEISLLKGSRHLQKKLGVQAQPTWKNLRFPRVMAKLFELDKVAGDFLIIDTTF